MNYIITALVMQFPSRNDYADMVIVKEGDYEVNDKEFNYLVLEKNKMKIILNKYKTVKTYGTVDYEIEDKPLYNHVLKYYDGIQSYYKSNNKKFDGFLLFNIKNLEKQAKFYDQHVKNIKKYVGKGSVTQEMVNEYEAKKADMENQLIEAKARLEALDNGKKSKTKDGKNDEVKNGRISNGYVTEPTSCINSLASDIKTEFMFPI
jgi:hypothetical protein